MGNRWEALALFAGTGGLREREATAATLVGRAATPTGGACAPKCSSAGATSRAWNGC